MLIAAIRTSYRPPQELWEFIRKQALLRNEEIALAKMMGGVGQTTKVTYTCHGCRTIDREVLVPARAGLDDPIIEWLEVVQRLVGLNHTQNSPHCLRRTCDIKIPMAGDVVGGALKQ